MNRLFMQKLINRMGLIGIALLIGGCSHMYGERGFIQNRGAEYQKAKSIPPLKIPPGLSSSTITAHYPVSDKNYPESDKEISLVPPEL